MRARVRNEAIKAGIAGTYGCRACGTYFRLGAADGLHCRRCRTGLPLVLVSEREQQTDGDDGHKRQKDQ